MCFSGYILLALALGQMQNSVGKLDFLAATYSCSVYL